MIRLYIVSILSVAVILAACLPAGPPAQRPAAENLTAPAPVVQERYWPVIDDFSAAADVIRPGENVTLRWSVSGAASVTIDNGLGSLPASGSIEVSPQRTTRYTLTASGRKGVSTAWVTVEVVDRSTFMPDLVITGVTHISGLLYYTVKNIGAADAGPSETYVYDQSGMLRDTSWVDGLKAGEEKTLPFTNYDWEGFKIKICADGDGRVKEADSDNNCYIPTFGFKFSYDFSQYASRAGWRGSAGLIRYSDGDAATGNVRKLTGFVSADNHTYRSAIEMVAPGDAYSWIEGIFGDWQEQWQAGGYMLPLQLPYNARFTARVGLAREAGEGGSAAFLFGVRDDRGEVVWWPAVEAKGDGSLHDIEIDLSSFGGRKVMTVLRVEAGAQPGAHRALWIEPRISQ
ncbi:MAG: CARDB domain-containing protein [Dehalococcoidia bacterium]